MVGRVLPRHRQRGRPLNSIVRLHVGTIGAALAITGAFVWFVGGNIVVERHYRRRGMSTWSKYKLLAFPFARFSRREWLELGAVFLVSVSCLGGGLLIASAV